MLLLLPRTVKAAFAVKQFRCPGALGLPLTGPCSSQGTSTCTWERTVNIQCKANNPGLSGQINQYDISLSLTID